MNNLKDISEINECIKGYKFVHLIYNDKFCNSFIEFINEQFSEKEHCFLVQIFFPDKDIILANNVFVLKKIDELDFSNSNIKCVICHSLFLIGEKDYWLKHKDIQQSKALWMIYGGDLYNVQRNEEEDLLRSSFKGYISDTDGDCDVVRTQYSLSNKKYYNAGYTFPITMKMIDEVLSCNTIKKRTENFVRIQINNSVDISTIAMMKTLLKFKNCNIKLVTPLSYGNKEVKKQIIEYGKKLWGDQFEYLDDFLSPEKYAEWISKNDILILNQNRQQGLGNSFASLALGLKVYIRSDVTTYTHFNSKRIKVFDTCCINNMNFEEFKLYGDIIKQNNMENVRKFFSNEYLKTLWEPIFYENQ